ncbi:MAG: hypothetical protein MUF71_17650 [Candidatus Kapabacteria bacterium]|jgi:hypothetical protein|nr:hypothetical protein [Candidatus Kapabacteria bacterium]
MTFSDFTLLSQLEAQFAVKSRSTQNLFAAAPEIEISAHLQTILSRGKRLAVAINTEKARSEFIIAPLLMEAWTMCQENHSLFSGIEFKVAPEEGLSGRCDFLISASSDMMFLTAPILTVVEAKNDDIPRGFAQCGAEMIAAARFNKEQGRPVETVYGCVTTGTEWRFLRFDDAIITIDTEDYLIADPAKILGILVHILQTAH